MMEKIEKSQDWQLIVNGKSKPWSVADYMNNPVTIDLNWGIDTNIYETTPVTFTLSQLLGGETLSGVVIDKDKRMVKCDIPIREKMRQYKLLIDFSKVKASLSDNLSVLIDGEEYPLHNRMLTLTGKQIDSTLVFLYKGLSCESSIDKEEGFITIILPIENGKLSVKGEEKLSCAKVKGQLLGSKTSLLLSFLTGTILAVIVMCLLIPTPTPEPLPNIEQGDGILPVEITPVSSYTLEDAIAYLDKHDVWDREEMWKYEELKGLFDAMNEFRFYDIKNDFERLQKSQKYEELEEFLRKHSLAKSRRLYFNINANEKQINFKGYMDYLHTLRINKGGYDDNNISIPSGRHMGSKGQVGQLSNHKDAKAKNDTDKGL